MDLEKWKPVVGIAGYEVSDQGRVRGPRRILKLLAYSRRGTPYLWAVMRLRGKNRRAHVGRLVAEAFISPRPEGMQVNHKDGNKKNNTPANLEWVTPKENVRHSFEIGLRRVQWGKNNSLGMRMVCSGGHPLTQIAWEEGYRRHCKLCTSARVARWKREKRRRLRAAGNWERV